MASALPQIGSVLLGGAALKQAFDPETGQTVVQQETDPLTQQATSGLYNQALQVASQPFIPYTGPRVAGFNPDQLRSFDATRSLFDTSMQTDPLTSLNMLSQQQAPSLLNVNLQDYQSPFQEQVIDRTLNEIQRRADIARSSAQDRAIGAGAFGGSRATILEEESQRPFVDAIADTTARLNQLGFESARAAAESDLQRDFANRRFQAGLLGGINAENLRRLGLLSSIGQQQQLLQQQALDIPFQEFTRAAQFPAQQLGLLATGVSGIPPMTTQTTGYTPTTFEGIGSALNILANPLFAGLLNPQQNQTT